MINRTTHHHLYFSSYSSSSLMKSKHRSHSPVILTSFIPRENVL
nr:MAG TPA: hypothetical protein [Caudoviricetes sp.]